MTRDLPYDDDSEAGDNYVEDTAYRIATGVARVARAGAYVTGGALLAAGGTRGASDDNTNHDSRIVGWSEAEDPKPDEPSPTVTFPDLTADSATPPAKLGPAVVSVSDQPHPDNHHYGTDAGFLPGTFGSLPSDATMSGYYGGGFGDAGGYTIPQPDYSAAYQGYHPESGVLDGHHGNTGVTIPWGDGQLTLPTVPSLPSFDGEPADFLPGLKIPGADGHLPGLPSAFLPGGLGDTGIPGALSPAPANPTPGTDFDGVGDSGIGMFVKTQWNVDAHVGLDGVWFKSDMKVEFDVGDVGHQYTEYQQQMGQYVKEGGPAAHSAGTQPGATATNPLAPNGDSAATNPATAGAVNPAAGASADPATAGGVNPAAGAGNPATAGAVDPAAGGAANPAAADMNPATAGANVLGGQTYGKPGGSAEDAHGATGHAGGVSTGGAAAPGTVGAGAAPTGIGAGGSAPGGVGGVSPQSGLGSGVSPQGGFGGAAAPGSPVAPAGSPAPVATAPAAPAFNAPVAPIAVAPVVPAAVAPVSVAPVAVAQPVVATPLQTTIQPDAAQHPIANLLGASGGPSPLTVPAVNTPSLFADHRAPVLAADGAGSTSHPATMVAKPMPASAAPGTAVPQVSVPPKPDVALTTAPSLPTMTKIPSVETGGATITPGTVGGGAHGGTTGGATTGGGATGGTDTDGPTGGATKVPEVTRPNSGDQTGTHGGTSTVPDTDGGSTHAPTVTQPSVPTADVTVPTVPTTQPQATQPHLPSQEITVPSVAPQPTVAPQATAPKPVPVKPIAEVNDSGPHVLAVSDAYALPVDDSVLFASHTSGFESGDSSVLFASDTSALGDSSSQYPADASGAGSHPSVLPLSEDSGWHATASLYDNGALSTQLISDSSFADNHFQVHGGADHTLLL
ncbi:hypothetical protein [Nocardia inohanensis]|uniref:hypothetical protein n=1 Tax=Nocardia inohanensis TaxID=209246 RepID=UPI0008340AF2|nr:hypothetical protein [Nocardia inohanensis]